MTPKETYISHLVGALGVCFFVVLVFYFLNNNKAIAPIYTDPKTFPAQSTIMIGGISITVERAVTQEERVRGLSHRTHLAPDSGLLFVFDKPGFFGIWMKDMLFPIDIVWINEDLVIVDMELNVRPDSFPTIFTPQSEALYVLELPAGFAEKNSIKVGDRVVI